MIDSYRFGEIVVDGKRYSSDVIIYPDRVNSNWWRKEGHSLHIEDIKDVIEANPEILIVGTGNSGLMQIPSKTVEFLKTRGITLIAEPTTKACETYNRLASTKNVIAALHLTC